ncbi:hypothetical protein EVG20_g6081 [Dentipellis fragilis]|uniref:Uncharacterized protein n=1 Tax=Dentipellis fragilis TaxID=205917 RepID=A0A4Y9YN58_9AGAM|nr:hypothetical protein EVG20_g6081 [Dentipellis fragilis]
MRDSSMLQDAAESSSSSMATSSTSSDAFSPKPGQHGARSAAGDHANADACPDKEMGGVRRPRMHGSRAGVSSESRVSSGRPASFFHIPHSRPHSDIDAMDPSFPADGGWVAQDRPRTIHFPSSQVDFTWAPQTHGEPSPQPIFPHGYAPPEMLPPQHFTAVVDPAPLPPPEAPLFNEPPAANDGWHTVDDAVNWSTEPPIPTAGGGLFEPDPFGFAMKRNAGEPVYPPNSEYAAPAPWVLAELRNSQPDRRLFVQYSGNVDASPLCTAKLPLQEAQEQGLVAPVVDSELFAPPPPPELADERKARRPTRLGRLFRAVKPATAESRSQADGKRRRIFGKLRAGFGTPPFFWLVARRHVLNTCSRSLSSRKGSRSDDRRNQSQNQNHTQDENENVADPARVVAPKEWREYGQWARPFLDGVQVENRRRLLLACAWPCMLTSHFSFQAAATATAPHRRGRRDREPQRPQSLAASRELDPGPAARRNPSAPSRIWAVRPQSAAPARRTRRRSTPSWSTGRGATLPSSGTCASARAASSTRRRR